MPDAGVIYAQPTPADLDYMAANLRAGDREEIHASSGSRDYRACLAFAVSHGRDTLLGCAPDGEPVLLFGVTTLSLLSNRGCPWALATERANEFKRSLVVGGRAYTAAMLQQYARLENMVDARNAQAVRWLRRCGYTIGPAQPHGPLGLLFHPFSIERPPNV